MFNGFTNEVDENDDDEAADNIIAFLEDIRLASRHSGPAAAAPPPGRRLLLLLPPMPAKTLISDPTAIDSMAALDVVTLCLAAGRKALEEEAFGASLR